MDKKMDELREILLADDLVEMMDDEMALKKVFEMVC